MAPGYLWVDHTAPEHPAHVDGLERGIRPYAECPIRDLKTA